MALRRKPTPPRTNAIIGSAMRFDFGGAQTWATIPTGDRRWQTEAWNQFDICGELRYAVGWKGNAMSQATLYAADVDPNTGRPTGPTDNTTAQTIADSVLGGPVKRPQHVYTIAINLEIAGEVWIVVLAGDTNTPDEWLVVSSTELNIQGKTAELVHPKTGLTRRLGGKDLLFRIWKPHPRLQLNADSAVRALLPTLREIENTSKNIAARLDSRLASAGILKVPTEADFASGDDDPEGPTGLSGQIAMTMRASLRDAGSAGSQVPIILQADRENLAAIEHISLETEVTKEVIQLRDSAIGRLAAGMDLPREVLEGMGDSNHWCVDDQTEILTTHGWVKHASLNVGDIVMTLNHTTGLGEWQPVMDIYRADVHGERMVSMETANHSSLTTLAHRWPVFRNRQKSGQAYVSREMVHSEDLTYAHSITTGAPCADTPTEAKYSDDVVELAAWFWTEGNISKSGAVSIAQSHTRNPDRVARIRAALTSLYGPASDSLRGTVHPTWREAVQANETSYGGPVTVFRLNRHAAAQLLTICPGKRVDLNFVRSLTTAQLHLFVDISAQGDGWHYRTGRLDIWQRDRDALEAYELALILLGHTVRLYESSGGWCVSPWRQTSIRPVKAAQQSPKASTVAEVDYTGTVWCPVTPNSTWFARRNGTVYYTGNSAWQVEEATYKTHLLPLLDLISDSLTTAYLIPALTVARVPNPDTYMLAFDGSTLIGEPDPLAEALELFDRGIITDEAVRIITSTPDEYAPQGEERLRALAERLVIAAPTLIQEPELRRRLGFTEEATPVTALPAARGAAPGAPEPSDGTPERTVTAGFQAASLSVMYALERAGNRLLNTQRLKEEYANIPRHELHVKLRPDLDRHGNLLEGAWRHDPMLAQRYDLDRYTTALLAVGVPHTDANLREWLARND